MAGRNLIAQHFYRCPQKAQILRSSPLSPGARATSRRLYSTSRPPRGSIGSHVAAGVCGGLILVAGGMPCPYTLLLRIITRVSAYSWYHFSEVKKVVDATKGIRTYLNKSFSNPGKASSNPALAYLRGAAKSYAATVPGASLFIDSAFDSVDEIFDAHQEEASIVTQRACDELQGIVRQNGDTLKSSS